MEINSPEQMMGAIKLLIVQMNRPQRKKFLMWVKRTRNECDFKYPEGYKIPEKEFVNEPKVEVVAEPVIAVPSTELILPPGSSESGALNTGQGS